MSTDNTTDAVHDLRRHASDGAWDEAIAVLDRHWAEMLRSDPSAVRAALSEIPRAVIERHPRWASGLQYLDRMGSRESTVTFRDAPASGPRNLLDSLASATARAAGSRARGALSVAARAAEGAREALDDASPEARAELSEALPELTYQWGMVWEAVGDLDAAAREYIDAHDYALVSGNTAVVALATASLALVHALAGRDRDAESWLGRIPSTDGHPWHARVEAVATLVRATLLVDALQHDDAARLLRGLSPEEVAERWPLRQFLRAFADDSAAAALQLTVEIETYERTRSGEAGVAAALLAVARSVAAARLTARAESALATDAFADASPWVRGLIGAAAAGLHARGGDYAAASAQVRRLRGTVTSFPRLLAPLLAIDAAAVLARGEAADAARAFELAAAMCVDQGLLLPLTMIPREDLAQLVALTPGALAPETAELVQARGSSRVHDPFLELTTSERRMLAELVTPQPLREIAERLVVSINTVKTQTRSVYRKVGATSRDELIALARQHGYA